jgi:dihydroflavonol-4-reductase
MTKLVFVTGADGMLGSSICRELIEQGYKIKAMCMKGRATNTINDLPVEMVFGDILDKKFLMHEMLGCDYVIHIAALLSVWPRRSDLMKKVNIQGTQNVMEIAKELKMERMVHIGTASSFGHGEKNNPGNENSAYAGFKFGMDYIESKYQAQLLLLKEYKDSGFPVIILNPTFMIGPFDFGPSSGQMLIAICKDKLKWYNRGGKNFVCSVDVAKAAVNALTKGRLGECYIAGNENLTYKEFFIKAFKSINKTFNMKPVSSSILLSLGFFSSAIARLNKKKPKLSYGMTLLAKENQYFSSKKAVTELNMPQTPIEDGIAQSVEWFKNNGYI